MNTPATRSYRQVARARVREQTHDAILDAAQAELAAGRWDETTLEDIAAAAGVTKTTLLRHFGSKSGLLAEGTERAMRRVREHRWQAPTENIAGAVDNLLEHYAQLGELSLVIGGSNRSRDFEQIGLSARQMHYDWVDHAFGTWLRAVSPGDRRRRRAALIAVCDVHAWRLLSHDLALSGADVRATLIQTVAAILEER
jgi:AcrR family transcriptional regulator